MQRVDLSLLVLAATELVLLVLERSDEERRALENAQVLRLLKCFTIRFRLFGVELRLERGVANSFKMRPCTETRAHQRLPLRQALIESEVSRRHGVTERAFSRWQLTREFALADDARKVHAGCSLASYRLVLLLLEDLLVDLVHG